MQKEKNLKRVLIGATIALSVLLPLGVAHATPDPNPDKGKDCDQSNDNAHNDDDHCLATTVPPTTTTSQPPPNPCDNQEIVDQDNRPTTTTTVSSTTTTSQPPPNPCDNQEIVDQDNCPKTTTTVSSTTTNPPCVEGCQTTTTATVPPPTATVPQTTTTSQTCPGSVRLGNWYADPQSNSSLRGKGTFKVTGGIQRFSGQRMILSTLDCGETLRVTHYKVEQGHALKVHQDGKLVIKQVPPLLN